MSKREEILESALTLFSTEGYGNVGINKIVDSVSVKKPTLYHHFGSKQGLLDALLSYYFTPYLDNLAEQCNYSGDIVNTLERVTRFSYEFAKQTPSLHFFILTLIFSPKESEAFKTAKPYIERQSNIIENLFLNAEKDHGNMKGRSFNFATTFLGMINTYISSYFDCKCNLSDQEVHGSCRQFMYGIFS